MKGDDFWEKLRQVFLRLPPYTSRFTVIALLCTLSILTMGGWFLHYAISPINTKQTEVYIAAGSSFKQIEQQLVGAGVVESDIRFAILARVMGVSHDMKAGEYAFSPQVSPKDILIIMEQGVTVSRSLTIAEGLNIFQIAEIFKKQDIANENDFLRLARDHDFLKKLGIPATSIEGYIFPDTYFFARGERISAIVVRMVQRMEEVFKEESAKVFGKDAALHSPLLTPNPLPLTPHNLSPHVILTLASIVEKETGVSAERPLVAEVFLNRLQKGMRLQADPTVTYGLSKFDAPLSRKDLKTSTPYNTYTNKGPPVGPICSPGRGSIAAVMLPASSGYYYFVSDNDGSHVFTKKLSEHNRAVAQYRRKKLQKND